MKKKTEMEFWLVWREDGAPPTFKHLSEPSAKEEAKRLALGEPDKLFVVLRAISGFRSPSRIEEVDFDDIPF